MEADVAIIASPSSGGDGVLVLAVGVGTAVMLFCVCLGGVAFRRATKTKGRVFERMRHRAAAIVTAPSPAPARNAPGQVLQAMRPNSSSSPKQAYREESTTEHDVFWEESTTAQDVRIGDLLKPRRSQPYDEWLNEAETIKPPDTSLPAALPMEWPPEVPPPPEPHGEESGTDNETPKPLKEAAPRECRDSAASSSMDADGVFTVQKLWALQEMELGV